MYMKDRKNIRNKEKGALRSFAMPFDTRFFFFFFWSFSQEDCNKKSNCLFNYFWILG